MFSAFNPSKWSSGQPKLRCPGSSWGFGALPKGLTSVVDTSCQSRETHNLGLPWVSSPTLYPLGHDCPQMMNVSTVCSGAAVLSAIIIKVPSRTHRPNRKTYRLMLIFEKWQILADISALMIYRLTTIAYFHIQIHPQHRRKFSFQGKIYEFKVLPFGLSLEPHIFTKCVEAAQP